MDFLFYCAEFPKTPSPKPARIPPQTPPLETLESWMDLALLEAESAIAHGDVPVGAIVVNIKTGEVIASRHNERELTQDTTAHAQVLALRDASLAIGSWRLNDYALDVTLEPCPMCAGASINSRIGLVVFGAADPKAGAMGTLYNLACDPRLNHEVQVVGGIHAKVGALLLTNYFAQRRR